MVKQSLLTPEVRSATTFLNKNDFSVDSIAPLLFDAGELDPTSRGNFAKLCRTIGEQLGPRDDASQHGDSVVGVNGLDLQHVKPDYLGGHLWIRPDAAGDLYDRASLMVVVRGASIGHSPDPTPADVGVIFPANQFSEIKDAKDPFEIRSRLVASERQSREDLKGHSQARSIDGDLSTVVNNELKKLNSLENDLIDEVLLMKQILTYSHNWRAYNKRLAVEDLRKKADKIIRGLVDAALVNSGLRPEQVAATQRARVSELYRIGSNREIASRWQGMATLAINHAKAKQGKVIQAREACYEVLPRV